MADFVDITKSAGEGIAGFLNPLFGSQTVTTTKTGETPTSSNKTTTIVIAVVVVVLISVGAFILLKNK